MFERECFMLSRDEIEKVLCKILPFKRLSYFTILMKTDGGSKPLRMEYLV